MPTNLLRPGILYLLNNNACNKFFINKLIAYILYSRIPSGKKSAHILTLSKGRGGGANPNLLGFGHYEKRGGGKEDLFQTFRGSISASAWITWIFLDTFWLEKKFIKEVHKNRQRRDAFWQCPYISGFSSRMASLNHLVNVFFF